MDWMEWMNYFLAFLLCLFLAPPAIVVLDEKWGFFFDHSEKENLEGSEKEPPDDIFKNLVYGIVFIESIITKVVVVAAFFLSCLAVINNYPDPIPTNAGFWGTIISLVTFLIICLMYMALIYFALMVGWPLMTLYQLLFGSANNYWIIVFLGLPLAVLGIWVAWALFKNKLKYPWQPQTARLRRRRRRENPGILINMKTWFRQNYPVIIIGIASTILIVVSKKAVASSSTYLIGSFLYDLLFTIGWPGLVLSPDWVDWTSNISQWVGLANVPSIQPVAEEINRFTSMLSFGGFAFFYSLFLSSLWRKSDKGKVVAVIVFFIFSSIGCLLFLLIGLGRTGYTSECKQMISPQNGFREIKFTENEENNRFFLESTTDAGVTWTPLFSYWESSKYLPQYCDNYGTLNADVYWVWGTEEIAVTHDGGRNWQTFAADSTGQGHISKVVFSDPMNGDVQFYFDYSLFALEYQTHDGGQTWELIHSGLYPTPTPLPTSIP